MPEIPAGFEPIPRPSPFNALLGPLYERLVAERRIVRASAIFARADKV
jgi:hypothetical protein